MINILVSSKPVDGLLYYSYEYCSYLNESGIDSKVIIVCHRNFAPIDYINAISTKYTHCKNIVFDNFIPNNNDVTMIMGRSMLTLSWQNFNDYSKEQQITLKMMFSKNLISVYSENHPTKYPIALDFYNPKKIIDLCDKEVYPNGVGKHFEKIINFSIYRPIKNNIQFKYLFLGTNKEYYSSVEKVIEQFPNHGILTYNAEYINNKNNNVFVPVNNLMGIFETYVYTKETFDPAPRIFQECKYFSKNVIYLRDKSIVDGGSVYWSRPLKKPNIKPILNAIKEFKNYAI